MEKEIFKTFQKVLVRDDDAEEWRASLFSNYNNDVELPYATTSGLYGFCIPYEGNEHLVGTNDTPKPTRWEVKNGQIYFYINHMFEVNKVINIDCPSDKHLFDIGNYFHTKEEAEEMIDKFKKLCKDE